MTGSGSHDDVHRLPLLGKGVGTPMSPSVKVLAVLVLLLEGVGLGLCLTQVDLTATDAVQTFSSTGYPTAYTNNQYETWTISSQDLSSRVRVDVTAASIERATGSSSCDFDHITFYDGNTTSDTQLGIACDSGAAYVSSGPRMLVVFSTDGTITAAGFQASYYRTNSSLTSSSSLSGGAIAGIVIACLVVVAAIVAAIVLCCLFYPKCRSLRERCLRRGSQSKSKVQPVRDGIEVHAMPVPSKKKQLPPLTTAPGQEGQAMQQSSKLPPIGGMATVSPYNPPPFFTQGSGSWRNGPRKSLSSQGSSGGKGGGGAGGGGVPPPFNY